MGMLTTPSFLIALPHLLDQNFHRAIILLVEHSEEGSVGYIVNKRSDVPITNLLEEPSEDVPESIHAWVGGPVETETGLIMCNDEWSQCEDQVVISGAKNVFTKMVEHEENPPDETLLHPYRFLVGYSGWGPGQLEDELKAGSWLHLDFDFNLLFNCPADEMWVKAMNHLGIDPDRLISQQQSYLT